MSSLKLPTYPKLSPEEVEQIVTKNCGNPPRKERLEYSIWLNTKKLEFYGTNPFYKGQEHTDHLQGLRDIIATAKSKLVELEKQTA